MDVTLKVLAGAKVGAKVAVRKNEFIIGRSDQCHLSVGTTSVSRRHCIITRAENRVMVKDLGSRNGTLLNGKKIDGEVELSAGDELAVGPLVFQVRISAGIKNAKAPKVKSVADAVERVADQGSDIGDDDISSWLVGPSAPAAANETQTIRLDETNALQLQSKAAEQNAGAETVAAETGDTEITADASEVLDGAESGEEAENQSKGPGKLPVRPDSPQTKDSREAAEMALRNWSRRR